MIFVCVSEHNAGKGLPFGLDKANVRQDDVDTGLELAGECYTQIHHQPFPPPGRADTIQIGVHANLAGAAQWQKN